MLKAFLESELEIFMQESSIRYNIAQKSHPILYNKRLPKNLTRKSFHYFNIIRYLELRKKKMKEYRGYIVLLNKIENRLLQLIAAYTTWLCLIKKDQFKLPTHVVLAAKIGTWSKNILGIFERTNFMEFILEKVVLGHALPDSE